MPTLKQEIVEMILKRFGNCPKDFPDKILSLIRERLPKEAFTDYPDTEDGRKARYENSLYNSAIQKMRDSLK